MHHFVIKYMLALLLLLTASVYGPALFPYPLDGAEDSGIRRLYAYEAQQQRPSGSKLPQGALLKSDAIKLTLQDKHFKHEYDQQPLSEALQKALESIFKSRDPSYGVVVIDISQPNQPEWAAIRPDTKQYTGSVGKILTLSGLFNALAKAFPKIEDRQRILRETLVVGGDWVNYDDHKVPFYQSASKTNRFSIVTPRDQFTLSEWIDHMVSSSSNAAGSVVWREAMLMQQFGMDYPVPPAVADEFFKKTSAAKLHQLSQTVINEPMLTIGIQAKDMQQGTLWTKFGKNKIPGIQSYASPRELARFLFHLEQGHLVDTWSSLEMKKYLYMTKRRYRYTYAPELHSSAVYFKSGSFFQCKPEESYSCVKYAGNKNNLMNSVAIVESLPDAKKPYRYLVALMSNVLKVNSAWDHSRLAAAIHSVVLTRNSTAVDEKGDLKQMTEAGNGDG